MDTVAHLYRYLRELEEQFIESDWFEAESIQLEIDNVTQELKARQAASLEEPFKTLAFRGFPSFIQINEDPL